jgi:hypothetical protein
MNCGARVGKHKKHNTKIEVEFALMIGDGEAVYLSRRCVDNLKLKNLKTGRACPLTPCNDRVLTMQK